MSKNSKDSSDYKSLRISLSNFDSKKKDHLQVLIKKLGGIYDENLEYGTNILVAANGLSNKYKSATLLNIPILTNKWLYKSIENDKFMPIDNFSLPIFNDLKYGVLGFNSEEISQIRQIIEKKEGKIITNINDIISCSDLNLILLKNSETKTYESFLNTLKIPVVNENWFEICLRRNILIRPENFLLGHKTISNQISIQREIFHSEMKIISENKLKKCLKEIDAGDNSYWFLSDCVIHFFNIEDPYEKLLKDIVNISGGFYINQYNISVTHVITENYQEEELNNFKKSGSNFYVLHPLWLKDCFFYKKRISEYEYYIMPGVNLRIPSFENSYNPVKNVFKRQMSHDESFSFYDMKTQRDNNTHQFKLNTQENKLPKNITSNNNEKNQKTTSLSPFKKETFEIKSFIFMKLNFFINTADFKELKPYRLRILENSGKIVDNLKTTKVLIYYVLTDGVSSLKIKAQKLENVNYVSFRWIDYCLEKKQIVKNHLELRLIHLSPLPFKMPLSCFKNSYMYVCGFATQEKIVLQNLMGIMGITLVYDKTKITHLICESEKNKKYQEILQIKYLGITQNLPKIVKAGWIFKCLTEGKIVDDQDFIFEGKI